jgi:HK97 family phage major capsid protein
VTGGWEGEGTNTIANSNSKYGMDVLTIRKMVASTAITLEELSDAEFDMQTEVSSDVGEFFGKLEGTGFVQGTGSPLQPEGFMTNALVPEFNSGAAADFTLDNLIDITGKLKTGYNPMFGFTRQTLARIRKFAGNDQYLWQTGTGVAGSAPNTLLGYPYVLIPDLDEIGANKYPIVFADFRRGYLIADRAAITVIRDQFTLKKEGKVEFTFSKRTTGKVMLPEAFYKLKCST